MPFQGINIITDTFIPQSNVRYVRLKVNDVSLTLSEIYQSLVDASWINKLQVAEALRGSLRARINDTIVRLSAIFTVNPNSIDKSTGEYIVSESARRYLVDVLHYTNIPLGELFKQKISGNPGFDFFSENLQNVILFGEAKYRNDNSGCNTSLRQINEFVQTQNDSKDVWDIQNMVSLNGLVNFEAGLKGFVASFTTWNETDQDVIDRIIRHNAYATLSSHQEFICIAIQLNP